jgi:predicted TIM-barrel fold metal-dependent hydrolase
MTPPLIALEEHWYSTAAFNLFDNSQKIGIETWPGALEKLSDAGYIRLKDMNRGKVSLQVISHCSADNPSPDVCRVGNDQLANEIHKSKETSERFTGFAVLPMDYPEVAAAEL